MGLRSLSISFARSQRGEGRSPHTVKLYSDCDGRLVRYLEAETGSDALSGLSRRLLSDFYATRLESCAASTVWTDWKCHRVFLRWLVTEEELASNPMDRMKAPLQTVKPVPVFLDADLKALVASCEGSGRLARRDMAILRLFLDCGLRRGEVVGLRWSDVDLASGVITVTGKCKTRIVAVGSKTLAALDRWSRIAGRGSEPAPSTPLFGLTGSGLYQALRGRAVVAGIDGFFVHRLRHTFAHRWLAARGNEGDLMQIAGWSSPSMLRRYGASAASERARAAQKNLALGDRF